MVDSILNLSEELKEGILKAQKIAKEFYNEKYSAAHLLKALLTKGSSLIDFLDRMNKDVKMKVVACHHLEK